MKKTAFSLLFTLLALAQLAAQTLPDGNKLLAEVDKIRYPESFFMRVKLDTVSPTEPTKTMIMESTYKKGFGTFMELQAPARSKGTKFLNQDNSLWIYNPKSGSSKPLRLSPMDSFQGSAFSNSDVSKTTYLDDYNAAVEAVETVDHPEFGKTEVYRIVATAKRPEATYGKIVMWVRKTDTVPLKMDYYAKSGLLFRQMLMSDYKTLAGRLRATHLEMESVDKKGTKSIITIEKMEVRTNIPDSLYNLNNLTR